LDILFGIVLLLVFVLFLLLLALPSIMALLGLIFGLKKLVPVKNRWIKFACIFAVFLIVPFVLNIIIDRDIRALISQSHGTLPLNYKSQNLAVMKTQRGSRKGPYCDTECLTLLISGNVVKYMIFQSDEVNLETKVSSFWLQQGEDCGPIEDLINRLSDHALNNTIRAMHLSGTCLRKGVDVLGNADVVVQHDTVENPSQLMFNFKTTVLSILTKPVGDNEFTEVYRNIRVRYTPFFPVLLPSFDYRDNKYRPDLLRNIKFRDINGTHNCRVDMFAESCSRRLHQYSSASKVLGLNITEYSLVKDGIIPSKDSQFGSVAKLVKKIVKEDRKPSQPEWNLIKHTMGNSSSLSGYNQLVIDVMSDTRFPVPPVYYGINKNMTDNEMSQLVSAIMNRIKMNVPSPLMEGDTEKRQLDILYRIINKLSREVLGPYFNDLIAAVPKRKNRKIYVEFFEKFGNRSVEPILQIIDDDKKRLKSLSKVMCKMGTDLSGIEVQLMKWAENNKIRFSGSNKSTIYALMALGVNEDRIKSTLDPDTFQYSTHFNTIKRTIQKYKSGKKYC